METARPARPDDTDRLLALHRQATDELVAQRGGAVWAAEVDRLGFAGFDLDDADQLVLAGEIDGAVVGFARVRADRLATGDLLARITDIFVEPEARGVGVGEALLDLAIEWAAGRGCRGIESLALPGMRETKNFFESAGMVARAIVVHRPLP